MPVLFNEVSTLIRVKIDSIYAKIKKTLLGIKNQQNSIYLMPKKRLEKFR